MKKYKLLKDVFNQEAGTIFEAEEGECIQIQENMVAITFVNPEAHPELFKEVEEIKEPSDEEVVYEWLTGLRLKCEIRDPVMNIAKELIRKGFDVSKLREGK